jgi:Pyrimidine dimer DNA glycosylase
MQVFMPWPDFEASARVTDTPRLQKGIVEAYQILRIGLGESDGWKSHPAVKMWAAYPDALAGYAIKMAVVWRERGGGSNKAVDGILSLADRYELDYLGAPKPWAAHSRAFCLSHQLNLVRKRPALYGKLFGLTEEETEKAAAEPYLWPAAPGMFQVHFRGGGLPFQKAFEGSVDRGTLIVPGSDAERRYRRDFPGLCDRYDRFYGQAALLTDVMQSLEAAYLSELGVIERMRR